MPPRHLKSLVTSVMWVAWLLARKPNIKVAVLSHNDDLSRTFAVKVKRLVQSDWFCRLAPNARISENNNRAQDFETAAGGAVLFASVEAGITGRGFDVIILDDPQSALQAQSKHLRKKVADTLTESISSRLNRAASGAIVVVQQRLHVDDLTGTLLKAGGWEHLCLPQQAMEQATYPTINGVWVRAAGDVLHPELIPLNTIPKLRSQYGDRTFYAQFQQAPSSVVGEIVKPDELREVAPFSYDRTKSYTLSIDTAAKAGPTSDYTAFLVIASDAQAHYVVDVVRTRVDLGGMRDIALNLCRTHGVGRVIIEDSASGPGLEMLLRERGCPAQLVNVGIRDKVTRLEDCRLFFSERRICIFRGKPWTREFIEELLRFPDADFDDMVDAFSLYLNDALNRLRSHPFPPCIAPRSAGDLELTYGARHGGRRGGHPMRPCNAGLGLGRLGLTRRR